MFFIERPYISDFFKATVRDNSIPVVNTNIAQKLGTYKGTNLISEDQVIEMVKKSENLPIYSTSENAIGWISKNLAFTDLPEKIESFKNKLKFRRQINPMFPRFYFKGVDLKDIGKIDFNKLPLPFIIKPAVGFMSIGVYKVSNREEWEQAVESIGREIKYAQKLYPAEVLNTTTFIIEECINGDEFAVDAYYNQSGKPVIMNIFNHAFSSDSDVSDRVYISSKKIIEENIKEFTEFLRQIGELTGVKNFPVHVELRRDRDGSLLPIEVNPMRFGGWCTTADITFLSYGFNPYLYYYMQKEPNWAEILEGKDGKLFSIIVLDNSTGVPGKDIRSFNYEKLLSRFERPLELRKIDFKQYPLFAFLFTETREDNFSELKYILDSDLTEFITI